MLQAFKEKEEELKLYLKEEEYKEKIEKLEFIEKKEKKEGMFVVNKGITDDRDESCKDIDLHEGYNIDCGLRGGKLSGG